MHFRGFFGKRETVDFIKKNFVASTFGSGNRLVLETASGKELSAGVDDLARGLEEFNRLPEAERKPKLSEQDLKAGPRGRGHPPAGMLVCRVFVRGFDRDAQGNLQDQSAAARRRVGTSAIQDHDLMRSTGPNTNFLWITEAEWKALVPRDPVKGWKGPFPTPLVDRISRYYLNDYTIGFNNTWGDEGSVRASDMTLAVDEVSSARVHLHLQGFVQLADDPVPSKAVTQGKFSLFGRLEYDRQKQAFDRFEIVALGDYKGVLREGEHLHPSNLTVGVSFNLVGPGHPGYGIPPGELQRGGHDNLKSYFKTEPDSIPGLKEYCATYDIR